jgi:hypothetical protein
MADETHEFQIGERVRLKDSKIGSAYAERYNLDSCLLGTVTAPRRRDYVRVEWDNGFGDSYPMASIHWLDLADFCPRCEEGYVVRGDYLCKGCRWGE